MKSKFDKNLVPSRESLIIENKRLKQQLNAAWEGSGLIAEQYDLLFENMPLGAQEKDYSLVKKEVDRLTSTGIDNLAQHFRDNPEHLFELMTSAKVTSVNQALLNIRGITSTEEFLLAENNIDSWWDDDWVNFFSEEISFLNKMKPHFGAGRTDTRIDGSRFTYRITTFVVAGHEDSWQRVITLHEDITDRKRVEEQQRLYQYELEQKVSERTRELKEAKGEAESANIAKGIFIANMSHEIRTPLNGVLGMAQLLEETPLTDKQKDYIGTISSVGNGLLALINGILDFSKLDADMVEVESIAFDLETLCLECLELVSGNAIDKDLELIFDYQPDCPRHFLGDPSCIRQILVNLLGNAVKFTQEGFVRLAVSHKATESNIAQLYFEIEDTGIGLALGASDRLFEQFTQADSTTTREFGGTGLGLAITRKLVTLLGGDIGAESIYGEGATFWIKCPLSITDQPAPVKTPSLKGTRILFVDSKKENRRIFHRILEHMGAKVTVASESTQAFAILNEAIQTDFPCQILILNDTKPDNCAVAMSKIICASDQFTDLKLLLLTSIGHKNAPDLFAKLGFSGYINNPSRYMTLHMVLSAICHHRQGDPLVTQYSIEEAKGSSEDIVETFQASILLVEDNLLNQTIAKKFLSKMGIKIDVANNGGEAINSFYAEDYDLIFMDCRMPHMDGYDATRAIRLLEKHLNRATIPIVALTANTSESDRLLCTQVGMNDVVTKPYRRADLSECLRQWLPPRCNLAG